MTSPIPELSRSEMVARAAAEAAVGALPDYAAQIAALEKRVEDLAGICERIPVHDNPWPALADLAERLDALPADPSPALAEFARTLADFKLSLLNERPANA